ncbi:probable helicase senataxin [Diorhabda carinulata]|uniref:probable helicase senataxin n=1 Tax=Diorhabda carinulata TaxID=1163345 RepID=UPI0025A1214A|nr:probable helicase senataxin [Diorhabda carinulata]XP_057665489.1 probable helicase senataxin [Diorhabda carinulata]
MAEGIWKLQGLLDDTEFVINKMIFKIGRHSAADIKTESTLISREHAVISTSANGMLHLKDCKSLNGTFINNVRITPFNEHPLKEGDVIVFGITETLLNDPEFNGPKLKYKVVKIGKDEDPKSDKKDVDTTDISTNHIKQENKLYTTIDDYVIISDEEEDNFNCSQIFHISQQINKVSEVQDEDQDPYRNIKEELKELDYCDVIPAVDLTEENDHFDSTSELLKVLENETTTACTQNLIDILDDTLVPEHINENCSNSENAIKNSSSPSIMILDEVNLNISSSTKTQKENSKNSETFLATVNIGDNNSRSSSSKKERKSRNKSSSFEKSPLKKVDVESNLKITKKSPKKSHSVQNLEAVRTSKSNSVTHVKSPRTDVHLEGESISHGKHYKPTTKRKTLDNKSPMPPKKSRRGSSMETIHIDTNLKVKNQEKQRKKLKEIANKSVQPKPPVSTKLQKDPRLQKSTEQNLTRSKNEKIQDGTVSSNLNNDNEVQWIGPYNEPAHCSKSIPDSTVKEDRSSLIWKISNVRRVHETYKKQQELNEEIIFRILSWNANWLLEQQQLDISPPVYGNIPLVKIPSNFDNYKTYYSVMCPLLMLELWQFVFQTTFNKEEERAPVIVEMLHERVIDSTSSFDCVYKIPTKNVGAMPIKQDDLCLLELRLKDVDNVYGLTCFGYIKCATRLHSENSIHFTVVAKKLNKPIKLRQIVVKVVANISCFLRLFKTLKTLKYSPLCQFVLNPMHLSSLMPIQSRSVRHTPLLNAIQKRITSEASEMALERKPGFYLIKGPPGTGKSSVIVSTILEILYKAKSQGISPHLLITAPSNAAIDALILKLNKARCELPDCERKMLRIVRIGPESSINELVNRFTLNFQTQKTMIIEKNLRKEYSKVEKHEDMTTFLKKTLGHQFFYEHKITEERILLGANLICTTLSSCMSYILQQTSKRNQLKFTACIVDEATQCTEMECLLPIELNVEKFILVGDPQQLPAVICNKEALQHGLDQSLFSRMFHNFEATDGSNRGSFPLQILCDQYRMKKEICDYPNRTFYNGKLNSFPKCFNPIQPQIFPYLVFNLNYSTSDDRSDYVNSNEVYLICNILKTLNINIKPNCSYSIGIITPYRAQKEMIMKGIAEAMLNSKVSITVNTVDSFQGMENDIIIISCVRYSSNCFLANEQRLNVALTRAKQALYIIGNYSLFKQCRPLYDLREDAKKRKLLLDIKTNPRHMPLLHKQILINANISTPSNS